MFWVMLIVRLIFWASVISIGVYVYNVGPEKALRDTGRIWGLLQGFVEEFVVAGNGANSATTSGYERGGGYGASYGYRNGRSSSGQYRYRG